MKLTLILMLSALWMQGCSTLPSNTFVASDPEALNEWQIEGSITLENDQGDHEAYFRYTQINSDYELAVNSKPAASISEASIKGNLQQGPNSETVSGSGKEAELAALIKSALPLNQLSYWLRALPATEAADITQKDSTVSQLKESAWNIS